MTLFSIFSEFLNKIHWRKIFFISFFLGAFFAYVILLLLWERRIGGIAALALVVFILPYLIIEIYTGWKRVHFWVYFLCILAVGGVIGIGNLAYIGFLILNIGFIISAWGIYTELHDRVYISSMRIIKKGIAGLLFPIALSMGLTVMHIYDTFTISCDDINHISKTIITLDRFPWVDQVSFSSINLETLNSIDDDFMSTQEISNSNNFGFDKNLQIFWQEFVIRISEQQRRIISQIQSDNDIINDSVCSTIIPMIRDRYEKTSFRASVAFLITLLLLPLIKLSLRLLAIFGRVVMKILLRFKLYEKKHLKIEVERLE